jgi:hypothetical protein
MKRITEVVVKGVLKVAGACRRAVQCVIPLLVGMSSVSCAIIGSPLPLESALNLKVERVEDHGTKVFLISGHNGNSAYAVLDSRVTIKDGVAHVVATQVLVTPLRRDGRISVKVRDDGTVKKIVFGREERQIWPSGT